MLALGATPSHLESAGQRPPRAGGPDALRPGPYAHLVDPAPQVRGAGHVRADRHRPARLISGRSRAIWPSRSSPNICWVDMLPRVRAGRSRPVFGTDRSAANAGPPLRSAEHAGGPAYSAHSLPALLSGVVSRTISRPIRQCRTVRSMPPVAAPSGPVSKGDRVVLRIAHRGQPPSLQGVGED